MSWFAFIVIVFIWVAVGLSVIALEYLDYRRDVYRDKKNNNSNDRR